MNSEHISLNNIIYNFGSYWNLHFIFVNKIIFGVYIKLTPKLCILKTYTNREKLQNCSRQLSGMNKLKKRGDVSSKMSPRSNRINVQKIKNIENVNVIISELKRSSSMPFSSRQKLFILNVNNL